MHSEKKFLADLSQQIQLTFTRGRTVLQEVMGWCIH